MPLNFSTPFTTMASSSEYKRIQKLTQKHHMSFRLIDPVKSEVVKHPRFSFTPRALFDLLVGQHILSRLENMDPKKPYFAILEQFPSAKKASEEYQEQMKPAVMPLLLQQNLTFQVSPTELLTIIRPLENADSYVIEGEWERTTNSNEKTKKTLSPFTLGSK